MSNSVNLSLDVTKTGIQNPLIKVRQGDGGFETLHTTVTSNGEPLNLQDWTITFMGTTAGNHKIVDANVNVVEAPNGIFDYTPSKAWGMDIGEFEMAYFKFVKGDGSASSANFRVSVIKAVDLTQEEAQNYISVVDATISEAKQHLTDSLADVTASVVATSSAASSMAVSVYNTASSAVNTINTTASSAVNQVDSAAYSASSVASSAANNVSYVASNAIVSINGAADVYVNKYGDETIYGDKTFTSPIIGRFKTNEIKDGYDLNGYQSDGTFLINGANNLVNYPANASKLATLVVHEISNSTATQTLIDTNNDIYTRTMGGNPPTWSSWFKVAKSSEVVHNTWNETIAGDKTFTGSVKFTGSIETQTVTNNGVTFTFKKFGNIVTVSGSGNYSGTNVNAFSTISSWVVPSGFMPSAIALVNANWGSNIGQMGFDASGAWLHRGPSVLSNSWVVITGSWSV